MPVVQYRTAVFERETIDEGKREIRVSLSSEAPVRAYGVEEILDHSESCVRMGRLRQSGVFLWNHDRNAVIGRLVDAKLDGRKLVATVRFAGPTNKLAEEKWHDVQAGILRETSVGYRVYDARLERSTEEVDTYRVTDWEPFEGSLVSIPADCSVGVGRSATTNQDETLPLPAQSTRSDSGHPSMETPTKPDAGNVITFADAQRQAAEAGNAALTAERSRVAAINEIVAKVGDKIPGLADKARSFIKDGKPVEEFQRSLLVDDLGAKSNLSTVPALSEMEKDGKRSYSLLRLFRHHLDPNVDIGFEREVSGNIRKLSHRQHQGDFTIPSEVLGIGRRAMNATSATAGGYTVSTDLLGDEMIPLLNNMTVAGGLGVRRLSGLVGNVAIPKQSGGATAYWVAEGAAITASASTFSQVLLTPRTCGAQTAVSKQLIAQSSIDAEAFARMELMERIAIEIDRVFFNGTGADGQPMGIFAKQVATTAGTPETGKVSKVTFSAAPSFSKLTNFIAQLMTSNVPLANLGWVINPTTYGVWAVTPRISGAAAGFLYEGSPNAGTAAGVSAKISNHLPTATANRCILGAWNQALWADWAGMDVVVDPFTRAAYQEIVVTTHTMLDFAFRHLQAFVVSTDSAAQ